MNPDDLEYKKNSRQDGSIEELKKDLYSRQGHFNSGEHDIPSFKKHSVEVAGDWQSEELPKPRHMFSSSSARLSFLKKLLLVSVIFFFGALGVSLFVFFGGSNIVSSNNVDISVLGPVSVGGGEPLGLEISIANQNNTTLESLDLLIEYPDGTRDAVDLNSPLKRYREGLGNVEKGQSVVKKVQAVLFGEESEVKNIDISAEYRVSGSNVILSKKKSYSVVISSSPVSVTVSSVKEINSNQDVSLTVDIVSNSTAVIQKLALSAAYPFGFSVVSSDPPAAWGGNFWQLGDLKPGGKKRVVIRGKIAGQEGDDRTFQFTAGTESPQNENILGTNFLTVPQKITVRRPFVGIDVALDGDSQSDPYIAKVGKTVRVDVSITNNLATKITDAKVSVKPSGEILDTTTVSPNSGYYRASDNTILWDQTLRNTLAVINPGENTLLGFSFATLPGERLDPKSNHEISIDVTVNAKSLNESGVSENVSYTVTKKVKVASAIGFSARSLYYSGGFRNYGPIPPKVGEETSYTIVWSLTNSLNDVGNVKVSAVLPSYVKWLGAVLPTGEKITYNPVGGQVLWEAGDLKAGMGFTESPKEVSFQVAIVPGLSQAGSAPDLVSQATVTGDDKFAGVSLGASGRAALTTDLPTDVSFRPGQGVVVK